jgi:hypothetical protein
VLFNNSQRELKWKCEPKGDENSFFFCVFLLDLLVNIYKNEMLKSVKLLN